MTDSSCTTIGQSVSIKGDLSAQEDLTIEGQVDGKVQLDQHVLTIGPNGRANAQLQAKVVNVQGTVTGNITATEKLSIGAQGTVKGDLTAIRIGIAEGATFDGQVDMQGVKATKAQPDVGTRHQAVTATAS